MTRFAAFVAAVTTAIVLAPLPAHAASSHQ